MIFGRIKLYLVAAGAFIAALFAAYFRGKQDEADAENERELNEYVKTRERMDDAGNGSSDDVREWLRKRGKQ